MADNVTNVNDIISKYLHPVAKNLTEVDFWNKLNEFNDDGNLAASAEPSVILVGPPTVNAFINVSSNQSNNTSGTNQNNNTVTTKLFTLGGVMNISYQAQKQQMPVFEIGSARPRVVPGPTSYFLSFSRLLTAHSNAKYALYKWLFNDYKNGINFIRAPGLSEKTHFHGLESELYKIPIGIYQIIATAGGKYFQYIAHEKCTIQNFSNSVQAGNVMIIDNISLMVTRTIPLNTDQLKTSSSYNGSEMVYKPKTN
jgi:hypothetical protein